MGRPRRRTSSGALVIPESNIQSTIITFLNRAKILNNRVNGAQVSVPGKNKYGKATVRRIRCNSMNGKADIEAWLYAENDSGFKIGIMLYIEVKASHGGVQSKSQKDFEKEIVSRGYYYVVARGLKDVYEKMVFIKKDIESNIPGFKIDIGRVKVT